MSQEKIHQLNILLNNVSVGILICIEPDRCIFTLSEEYIQNTDRPTLTLSLKDQDSEELKNVLWKSNVLLPPYFSNLLPEGPLRKYLAELNHLNAQREFYLLETLGADLPGAIRVIKGDDIQEIPSHVKEERLAEQQDASIEQRLRFSLGGIQLKFSAIMDVTGGLTIPAEGIGGSWIAKLASSQLTNIPENEYSMLQLAGLVGIEIPEARLVKTASIENLPPLPPDRSNTCLAVKRFDRSEDGERIHIEDFAQVFDVLPDKKYTKEISYAYIAATIWKFMGEDSLKEFIRRIVFNIAICNTDMHLKNWSLIYKDKITPQLAPAYDLVATFPYVKNDELALKLGDTRLMSEVTLHTFKKLVLAAKLPEHIVIDTVNETIAKFMSVWRQNNTQLPIPAFVKDSIEGHLKKVPLFW